MVTTVIADNQVMEQEGDSGSTQHHTSNASKHCLCYLMMSHSVSWEWEAAGGASDNRPLVVHTCNLSRALSSPFPEYNIITSTM